MHRNHHPIAALIAVIFAGCVTSGTHQAVLDDLSRTQESLKSTEAKQAECKEQLTLAMDQNHQLISKVQDMGQDVEQLLGEKSELSKERERLVKEQEELAMEVAELRRIRAAAEARNAEYQSLMSRLNKMIDAGTLQVKVRGGRMLVQLASDVVFPPGGVRIKPAAKEAIIELAETMQQFEDRKFLVVGHSDSTPISTARFPSNWELSTQRAIEVVKLMIEAGVAPGILSAAGSAEFDPLQDDHGDAEIRAQNRRVEIVFLPKIDELPGFEQQGGASASR